MNILTAIQIILSLLSAIMGFLCLGSIVGIHKIQQQILSILLTGNTENIILVDEETGEEMPLSEFLRTLAGDNEEDLEKNNDEKLAKKLGVI